ncbi:hypothetical protein [Paenibacillus eucommiae]|uniref:Uncharacterized protein n=1 Tax=Paenibacillus eucommiae TaxID=1355755 RepID=A0ABS4IW22_9BACL|nr:hypothetical protein [Paenibacillus eucommiae]MBP1991031.1 hypothetical protein [Paenibacillus eucommiae]
MNGMSSDHEMFIWTPLIGFDKEHKDRGVDEYYSKLGFTPDGISLFLFCPDIVHDHNGMDAERVLPPDNCNYYSNIRNEIREIQEWTSYELRELVGGLNSRGTETYMGIMGVFANDDSQGSVHYNPGHREWLNDHKELLGVMPDYTGHLNVLKRFKDGTYYEDFFLAKARAALKDYGFSGLHVSDCFCPPAADAKGGDFSDDMVDQFMTYSGIKLPDEICAAVSDEDREGIRKRGTYIWNRYKLEWLEFLSWRWVSFWQKICDGLHADGKKVIVNNAWCSEPFEALYRFGIDYKKLYAAGVDYFAAETVPTSVHMGDSEEGTYRMYNYMTMPSFMRAFAPEGKLLCLNGVKDSTEEWSTMTHFPSNVEREIYALTNYYLQTPSGLKRSTDGFLVCLGDGLTKEEWSWLKERWDIGFGEIPEKVLTPTLIWSDSALYKLLPDYIATRRWSMHKTVYELAKCGGQVGDFARIEDLNYVSGPIFIPNVDLLPEDELKQLASYNRGAVICTSLVERGFQMPDTRKPDIYFEDLAADFKMCIMAYDMPYIDYQDITATLGEDDGSADVQGDPRYAEDPSWFLDNLVYRKASTGFVKACGKLIRAAYDCDLSASIENPLLPMQMKDGRIRLLIGNDNRLQYRKPIIKAKKPFKYVVSLSKFPSLPARLMDDQGHSIIPKLEHKHQPVIAYGFMAKIPPGGLTIFDVTFAKGDDDE